MTILATGTDTLREQRIRECAYRLWVEEGRPDGRALDHWTRAVTLVGETAEAFRGKARKRPGARKARKNA